MAEIWFIRHGESAANAGEVVHDMTAVPLTEKGHAQAKALSLTFGKAPDLIITTPYLRTKQTAQYTVDRFPGVPHETWPLQEFSCLSPANFNGTRLAQRLPLAKLFWEKCDPDHVDGEGAESFSAMVDRVRGALERLQARPEQHIVIFAHGHIMRVAELLIENPARSAKEVMMAMVDEKSREPVANCGIMKVTADEKGLRLKTPAPPPSRPRGPSL